MTENISATRLRELLNYDPLTGQWRWKVKRRKSKINGLVGRKNKKTGRWLILVDGKLYLGYRLAWLYMTGVWPVCEIDHENVDPSDDRWVNLREATRSQNGCNRPAQRNNKLGIKGVSFCEKRQRYEASVAMNGKKIHLGRFRTKEEADSAYRKASAELHGKFARAD